MPGSAGARGNRRADGMPIRWPGMCTGARALRRRPKSSARTPCRNTPGMSPDHRCRSGGFGRPGCRGIPEIPTWRRTWPWRPLLVEIAAELLALLGAVELLQRLRLDLPYAFARQVHHLADLFESLGFLAVEPEPELDHLFLLGVQLIQGRMQQRLERRTKKQRIRRGHHFLFELVGQVEVVLLVDHRAERHVVVGDPEQRKHLFDGNLEASGDLVRAGVPLQLECERGDGLADPVKEVCLFLREPEGAALVGECVNDRLPHPPDRIRDELDVFLRVEPLGRLDQPDVPLVDQVEEAEAAPPVFLGEADDETEVGLHELLEGLSIPLPDLRSELLLIVGGDPGQPGYFLEVLLETLGARASSALRSFLLVHRLEPTLS